MVVSSSFLAVHLPVNDLYCNSEPSCTVNVVVSTSANPVRCRDYAAVTVPESPLGPGTVTRVT